MLHPSYHNANVNSPHAIHKGPSVTRRSLFTLARRETAEEMHFRHQQYGAMYAFKLRCLYYAKRRLRQSLHEGHNEDIG